MSVAAYACAHFGKSLWWNGSELFLTFYLTEYVHLSGIAAAIAIAIGLGIGAVLDIALAACANVFASPARAGRMQFLGSLGSAVALLIFGGTLLMDPQWRIAAVVTASILFRIAYAFYDLPQNCLLSLAGWSAADRRIATASRTVGSSAALIAVSCVMSLAAGPDAIVHRFGLFWLVGGASVAITSAFWLQRSTVLFDQVRQFTRPAQEVSALWSIALMAMVCLSVPAFSKFAPFAMAYAQPGGAKLIMVMSAIAMIASQPFWIWSIGRFGHGSSAVVCAALLIVGATPMLEAAHQSLALIPISAIVGTASGGLGTIIWSSFAERTSCRDALEIAPAAARLTAVAKLSLACAALLIGAALEATDYGRDSAGLWMTMGGFMLLGGIGVLLIALPLVIRPGKLAGSA